MTRSTKLFLAATVFGLMTAGAMTAAIHAAPAEKFDLTELADGETRDFITGERKVTATRTGEVVQISMSKDDGAIREFRCKVGRDKCFIMTFSGDQGQEGMKMMFISRDEGMIDHDVLVHSSQLGDGDSHSMVIMQSSDSDNGEVVVEKRVRMVTAGDGEVVFEGGDEHANLWVAAGEGEGFAFDTIHTSEGGHMAFVTCGDDGKVALRCPEGDTTMRVDKSEADLGYECPKHGQKLEKISPEHFIRRMKRRIERQRAGDSENR